LQMGFYPDTGRCIGTGNTDPCFPCNGPNRSVGIELLTKETRIEFTMGDLVFANDSWDATCDAIDGLVLSYESGTGDGCDYSGATLTLVGDLSGVPVKTVGPYSEFCTECPKPPTMYLTFADMGETYFEYEQYNTTIDFSWLNGTWALPAGNIHCGLFILGMGSDCNWWTLSLEALDGMVLWSDPTDTYVLVAERPSWGATKSLIACGFYEGTPSYFGVCIILIVKGLRYGAIGHIILHNRVVITGDLPNTDCFTNFQSGAWEPYVWPDRYGLLNWGWLEEGASDFPGTWSVEGGT